ncbi:cadherin-99C [Drosophila pseudoobscura]|uniref:Cadherin-99C n=1 Tax=Drosophila pseudoobscura pseudoobscura TaxID=46245 RepID=A0A6I8ULY0_DROPS|nr:cadherin-99C [Drosophila pseudoobscura]
MSANSNISAMQGLGLLGLLILLSSAVLGKSQMCEVETGQTNIILDIEESRETFIGQQTTPPELPIFGDPETEIDLDLVFPKGQPTFQLIGKRLQLLQPLDRDEENLSHIVFQVSCTIRSSNKKRNIPIIVRVSDINDNAPRFMNTPYEVTVPESTPVGTTIFRNIQALDKDAGVNGLVEYFIAEQSINATEDEKLTSADGYGTFAISFPHQGQVTVSKILDYEKVQRYFVTIVASDRARNTEHRLSSTTTLTVNIADSDDLDPSFIYRGCVSVEGACINPEYTASVPAGSLLGVLNVLPERIQAVDLDTINSRIRYSFASGMPGNYEDYFEIDEETGVLKQTKAIDTSTAKRYDIIVRAEEISPAPRRFTTAKLAIAVKPVDANPPAISSSASEGYVDENSPIGTRVLDGNGNPISFRTTDADLGEGDPKPDYIYELTTPSFNVTSGGILVVNEDNLDRDPPAPGRFKFQVVAREPRTNAASAPLSLTVNLRDINDNAPKLAMVSPIAITANSGDQSESRLVTQVTAIDNDEGPNAVVAYSIYHVSNNGIQKFTIDEQTGEIRTHGRLLAGEQYSITVQATDIGGLSSQAIVEVSVTPGPNTKPPRFQKPIYEVQVSEGAEINSTVTVVHADDPENDAVVYSIISGNDLRQFAVGQETGVIIVIRKLDRESLTRYQLIMRAEDSGGLSSSATVNIKVTDINDKNPEFDVSTLPYVFQVDEGTADAFVGVVHATDADEGINAEITYSIPTDVPFTINGTSGELRTASQLDYERLNEYKFVVTAKDGAPDARLGTASVTVLVHDIPDEVPKFSDARIDVHIPENEESFLVATVQAFDPDTISEITYVLRKGDAELFKVSATTGEVHTIKGLDYENQRQHQLTIGTIENDGDGPGDTLQLVVDVEDRNDLPPRFITVPDPVTVNDDQAIGTIIATLPAIDGDGTSPGNVVRYEIVGRGKAPKYFQVDPDTGAVRIRDELRKEVDTEYHVDIRAYDMGDPQLSSVAPLRVDVRHLALSQNNDMNMDTKLQSGMIMSTENIGLGFSDDSYTTSVPESTEVNSTLKIVQIINSKQSTSGPADFRCEFVLGNDEEKFNLSLADHGCSIILVQSLDFENKSSYMLQLRLVSHRYFVNPLKDKTTVNIIVQDENDNAPEFVFNRLRGQRDTFYTVVTSDMDVDTTILQVRATDRDSGKFGLVRYKLYDDEDMGISLPTSFFVMTEDGVLRTARHFRNEEAFPMTFSVEARDSDAQEQGSHRTRARIVVNKLTDINRMALSFPNAAPSEIRNYHTEVEELLDEKTGLVSGIERFSNQKYLANNGTVIENQAATDVWFYLIDPKSEKLLKRNDSIVETTLLEPAARLELNFALPRAKADGISVPIEVKEHVHKIKAAIDIDDEVFPFTLIAISLIILILGTIGIIYICISWSKYKNFKQRMRQYSSTSPTRYDPVIVNQQASNASETVASMKEYETQMLAMAVPPDGDDDLQLDFSAKNHAFSLDNVSYITHKENSNGNSHGAGGQSSPSHSDATTATIATLRRHNNLNNMNNNLAINNRQNTFNRTLEINTRNNANPLGSPQNTNGALSGTLTLGRIKHQNTNHYQNGGSNGDNGVGRNNLAIAKNNAYSTMGRRGNTFCGAGLLNGCVDSSGNGDLMNSSTLGRHSQLNNRMYSGEVPITNPLFQRSTGDGHNHISCTNENVSFGKRDYGQIGFSYLNDLDRSEVETTTEL